VLNGHALSGVPPQLSRNRKVRPPLQSGPVVAGRYCFHDQTVEQAAELMSKAQIRRLPIVNRDKRLASIAALADLATEPRASRPAKRWLVPKSQRQGMPAR
jgi:CBS-domain-containing membrane protein